MRQAVPKERLLEWEVQAGWRPLCAFLGVDEPEGTFPHISDSKELVGWHGVMRDTAVFRSFVNTFTYRSYVWGPLMGWAVWEWSV